MSIDITIIDPDDDEDSEVLPEVRFDAETIRWLARLSRVTGTHPRIMVASMVRAFRLEDESHRISQH